MWLEIWDELTQTSEKYDGYGHMVGKSGVSSDPTLGVVDRTFYIPLQFWFNRNPGLALPLIALQYHEVKINIEFRTLKECLLAYDAGVVSNAVTLTSAGSSTIKFEHAQLYVDYIYLDTEERRRFAQESHEYLIDQLQYTGADSLTLKENAQFQYRMNFNHPVKELVWVLQRSDCAPQGGDLSTNDWFNFSSFGPHADITAGLTGDLMSNSRQGCNILLNGHDRFTPRPASYFRLVQPYQHHTRIPSRHIYLYSFGLRPEEHQPSGTVNMSRIDNAQLVYKIAGESATNGAFAGVSGNLHVFATNLNIRFSDGQKPLLVF